MALRNSSFFLRFILVGLIAHAYVGLRLIPDAPVSPTMQWSAVAALLLSCVLIPLGMLSRSAGRPPWSDRLAWVGLLTMGFFSSLFVFTVIRDGLLLIAWCVHRLLNITIPSALTSWSAVAVPSIALLISWVGLINARRIARVKSVIVPITHLPPEFDGLRIVQISDIHIGPTIKHDYVQAIVTTVNALQPDLIAITGDIVDGNVAQLGPHAQPLRALRAPYGVYLVTGNHEYYSGVDPWIKEFRRLGLHVLQNEHTVVQIGHQPLIVAGVTDYNAGAFDPKQRSNPARALLGAPADAKVKLLLAHQPRSASAAAPLGYTLQLSGHTHGGQFFPWGFFVRLQQPYTAGLHKLKGMWIYVSRGTGYWGPPLRLAAASEITLLTLRCAQLDTSPGTVDTAA